MWVQTLTLQHFRNYKDLSLELTEGQNILFGKNGQGKTNIVEAIALLAYLKSFRVSSLNHLIQFNHDFYRAVAHIKDEQNQTTNISHFFGRHNGKQKKEFRVNEVVKRPEDLFGIVRVVLFSPEQLNLLLLGPEYRRRHLNFLVLQKEPRLWREFLLYAEVLRNRNALLYQISTGRAAENELEYWDEKLIEHGTKIFIARYEAIQLLNSTIQEYFGQIAFEKNDQCAVRFEDGLSAWKENEAPTAERFRTTLQVMRRREQEKRTTLVGPHRDNFTFLINQKDASRFGSRGELRTAILAMKFAERDVLSPGSNPILLLDDVMSELDVSRRRVILRLSKGHQTIITSSEEHSDHDKRAGALFRVENSKITRV